jgi:hypothetical protein
VASPVLAQIEIADDAEAWRSLGFELAGASASVGDVALRFSPPGGERGIASWALTGIAAGDLDGLATAAHRRPSTPAPGANPNGAIAIDHVVVTTPDFDRTVAAFERAGLELRRVRELGDGAQRARQGFFRAGTPIVELVEAPEPGSGPARFWGLTFVVEDIDRLAAQLGERLGSVRDAVQPGRRIATVRRTAGIGVPVAFMTPHVRPSEVAQAS